MAGTYLLVLPWSPDEVGGVNTFARNLTAELRHQEWLQPVIAADDRNALLPQNETHFVRFCFTLVEDRSPARLFASLCRLPAQLWRLYLLLQSRKVEVVNFHYPGLRPLGVSILKRLGLFRGRILLSFHGTDERPSRTVTEEWLRRRIVNAADERIACSRSLAARLATNLGIAPSKVAVIYGGADPRIFRPRSMATTPRLGHLPSQYLVSVGAFKPRKGQMVLLRAFSLLVDRWPNLHLCVAGGSGPEFQRLSSVAAELGLAERVHLFANLHQHEVASLLANALACVQPSLEEALGLAICEAGAAGIPVIASNLSGHAELMEDGLTGKLFTVGDSRACAAAIVEVLERPYAARSMAAALRDKVLSTFTWEACANRYRALYDSRRPDARVIPSVPSPLFPRDEGPQFMA